MRWPRIGSLLHIVFAAYKAYMIVYDGRVWTRRKTIAPNYFAFRAVKPVDSPVVESQD